MIQVTHKILGRTIRIILPFTLKMNNTFATIAFAQSSVKCLSDIGFREETFSDFLTIRFLRSSPAVLCSNTRDSQQNDLWHRLSRFATGRMRLGPERPQVRSTKDKPEIDLAFVLAGFLLLSGRLENDHVVEIDDAVAIEIKRLRVLLHRFAVNVES